MTRRRPRSLRPDEAELWQEVARRTTPLSKPMPKPATLTAAKAPEKPQPKAAPAPIAPFRIGETATATASAPPAARTATQVNMARKAFARMKRGKLKPEARIDLHGMTVAAAQPVLTRFLLDAHRDGKRLVLVITGKGRGGDDDGPIPERRGVLRQMLPTWLRGGALAQIVLQVNEAHATHGGSGAFYVYLRRPGRG